MADVQGASGIGRDEFHVDLLAAARTGISIGVAKRQNRANQLRPEGRLQPHVDEARARYIDACDVLMHGEPLGQSFSKLARVLAGGLGKHHRRVGRDITVRKVARRLHHDARQIQRPRQFSAGRKLRDRIDHTGMNMRKKVHEIAPELKFGYAFRRDRAADQARRRALRLCVALNPQPQFVA